MKGSGIQKALAISKVASTWRTQGVICWAIGSLDGEGAAWAMFCILITTSSVDTSADEDAARRISAGDARPLKIACSSRTPDHRPGALFPQAPLRIEAGLIGMMLAGRTERGGGEM